MGQYHKSITEYEDVKVCMADTLELGIEKGISKVIKNGLKKGFSIDILSKITDLTPEQIYQMQ